MHRWINPILYMPCPYVQLVVILDALHTLYQRLLDDESLLRSPDPIFTSLLPSPVLALGAPYLSFLEQTLSPPLTPLRIHIA